MGGACCAACTVDSVSGAGDEELSVLPNTPRDRNGKRLRTPLSPITEVLAHEGTDVVSLEEAKDSSRMEAEATDGAVLEEKPSLAPEGTDVAPTEDKSLDKLSDMAPTEETRSLPLPTPPPEEEKEELPEPEEREGRSTPPSKVAPAGCLTAGADDWANWTMADACTPTKHIAEEDWADWEGAKAKVCDPLVPGTIQQAVIITEAVEDAKEVPLLRALSLAAPDIPAVWPRFASIEAWIAGLPELNNVPVKQSVLTELARSAHNVQQAADAVVVRPVLWFKRPSVGTWLIHRLPSRTPAAGQQIRAPHPVHSAQQPRRDVLLFHQVVKDLAPPASHKEVELDTAFVRTAVALPVELKHQRGKSFRLLPSVGTWLMTLPNRPKVDAFEGASESEELKMEFLPRVPIFSLPTLPKVMSPNRRHLPSGKESVLAFDPYAVEDEPSTTATDTDDPDKEQCQIS